MYEKRYGTEWMFDSAEGLSRLAASRGIDPATLAVSWVAQHAGVWGPIISARSAAQLKPSLEAISFDMDAALYTEMSNLSPTPPPATDRLEEAG